MIIFPAIDIKEGKVVRLVQGRFDKITEYAQDPVTVAKHWEAEGSRWLHVVDLDGAQTGTMRNLFVIQEIARSVKIPIQVGGGIRGETEMHELWKAGVQRVILGTRAVNDRDFLKRILSIGKEKVAVSLDTSKGFVAERGWTNVSKVRASTFAKELQDLGLKCLIFTDIAKDGMLSGPNFKAIEDMLKTVKIPLIASGGVSNLNDIKKLMKLESKGLIGAITGKAIYEGKLNLREALKLCGPSERDDV